MKTFKFWVIGLMTIVSLISCEKDDKDKKTEELGVPVLTADKTSVVLENLQTKAISFSWSDAGADAEVSATYAVYINLPDRDMFTNPVSFDADDALELDLTHEQLNNALVTGLGINPGATVSVKVAVYASYEGFESVLSNKLDLTVTAYTDLPESLILVGDALTGQWDLSKGVVLNSTENGIYTGTAEFLVGPVSLNYGIKFYYGADDDRFLGKEEVSTEFGKLDIFSAGDHKIPLAVDGKTTGKYDITVNMNTMQLTLTRTGDINFVLPDEIHFVGEAVDWKWNWEDPTRQVLTKQAEGVYKVENVNLAFGDDNNPLGFKVVPLPNHYAIYYAADESSVEGNVKIAEILNSEAPQFYPGKLGYANGVYTIEMNFNTKVMTLTRTVAPDLWLRGPSTEGGWGGNGVTIPNIAENVWEGTDIKLNFSDDGLKIYDGYQVWWPWYGQDAGESFGNLISVPDQATTDALGDPMLKPGLAGYTSGMYTVNINMNTMKVTLTKTGDIPTSPMWIYGPALPGGWGGSGALIPSKSDNVWEANGVSLDFTSGGFKVYNGFQAWWPWYGQEAGEDFGNMISIPDQETTNTLGDPMFKPADAGYENGTYTVNINKTTMKVTLTKE